mmetsp:Transcript_7879/g.20597  ORF Transcript_7879/g.20597 Transcript_7879/m.20597 type:complete len:98 (+) Transcript_7879:225-518(+)
MYMPDSHQPFALIHTPHAPEAWCPPHGLTQLASSPPTHTSTKSTPLQPPPCPPEGGGWQHAAGPSANVHTKWPAAPQLGRLRPSSAQLEVGFPQALQ